jgi:putative phosphoribosyl transferase
MVRKKVPIRILTRNSVPFADREEAGRLLAGELREYRTKNVVVVGIPRGGMVVANELAKGLGVDVDIVLSHKLGSPGYEELALGAVTEDGRCVLNKQLVEDMGIVDSFIQKEADWQLAEIKRRGQLFRGSKPKIPLEGKIVIVTDDGVATGATIQAALLAIRAEKPEKIIVALPVGPEDTIRRLAEDADEMVCLKAPPLFTAVGQFYENFLPVEDSEVLSILKERQAGRS